MKTLFNSFFLALLLTGPALAQNYSMDWYSIDGGSSTLTSEPYSLSGTIGQPDARHTHLSSGRYTLVGGFFGAINFKGELPPMTVLRISPGQLELTWKNENPEAGVEFVLQTSTLLNSSAWEDVSVATLDNSGNWTLILNSPNERRFYRIVQRNP